MPRLSGHIVGNTLLGLGLSLLVGGPRHGVLRFNLRVTGLTSALMILAAAGLLLPAVFGALVPDQRRLEEVSLRVGLILLVAYAAYLALPAAWTHRPGE